jgi:hypothetical protein
MNGASRPKQLMATPASPPFAATKSKSKMSLARASWPLAAISTNFVPHGV